MALEYDFAVVGSGFGGSVAALRLSQKGYRVVVIESGRRWGPDHFPESSWDLKKYLWSPGLRCFGLNRMSLMRHALVLGGVGVGGGSLNYGNTLIRPKASFYDDPKVTKMGGEAALGPYYNLAEKMMGVAPNPFMVEPDRLVRETAEEYGRGDTFQPSPVGVYFGEPEETVPDPYFEGEGPERTGCNACGRCFIGCRVGSKNTLDCNYLFLAEKLGAEIMAETQVTEIAPLSPDGSDGYRLSLRNSTSVLGRPRRTLNARGVVLAAGVVGTLELLHRSRRAGALDRISATLGDCVRTNSEVLAAVTSRDRTLDYSKGISASSSVFPDEHTQIQADRYPAGSDSLILMSTLMVDGGGRLLRPLRWLATALRHPVDFLRLLWPFGRARRTIILVVMQDLQSSLRFLWRRRWWWPFSRHLKSAHGEGDQIPTYIPMANDFARRLARRMDGIPLSATTEVLLDRPATAHILGGCPMGESADDGVIDHDHRIHGYQNLLVCDGTVIPANLGANPALSILALSERAMSLVPTKSGKHHTFDFERTWGVSNLLNTTTKDRCHA